MATVEDTLAGKREELAQLVNEQENLKSEWADKRFDNITRDDFNAREAKIEELEAFIAEKEKVEAIMERHAKQNGEALERATFHTARPGVARGNDIYDLSTINRSWDNPEHEVRELRDRALHSIERSRFPYTPKGKEDTQGHIEDLLERADTLGDGLIARRLLMTGSEEYKRAWSKAVAGGYPMLSREEQGMLYRAASLTTTSGGFAVPFVLDPTVLPSSSGALNPYRSSSSVTSISVDEWRGVTSDGITAAFQAEAAATTDNTPTLAQPTVSTEMARAFVPYSIEIGQDWGSFASEMAGMFADSKDVLEATKFAVGSGTNEPFGFITGTSASVFTASNTNSLVVADIYGVHNALGPRFRARAAWTMNNAVADRIRQLDTSGGANLWVSNLQLRSAAVASTMTDGRMGADLLEHPAYEASAQSGTFTTGQLIAGVGDFSYFKIIDRVGMTVENVQHLFGASQGNLPTGQRGLLAYWRVGSKVLAANAFRLLKLA